MANERTQHRRCKCGNIFEACMPRQHRCFYCIMKDRPEKPADDGERRASTDFDEWFIYKWHNIRKAAYELKGVEFEFDDGIRGAWKGRNKG